MKYKFKLIFEGNNPDLDREIFQQSLPSNFEVQEQYGDFYIEVEQNIKKEEQLKYLVNRELDRYFFLTFIKVRSKIVKSTITMVHTVRYRSYGSLPKNIQPQKWNYNLPLQLRLWSLADEVDDIVTKILLYFQIIEISFPETNCDKQYPKYNDTSKPPHPRTECKFIRHLVVHAGEVKYEQLKKYCEGYLKIPAVMLDRSDPEYMEIVNNKIEILKQQARSVIELSLT